MMQEPEFTTTIEHTEELLRELEFTDEAKNYARVLAYRYRHRLNHTPKSIASASVYLAGKVCRNNIISQPLIQDVNGTSPDTIRLVYREIAEGEDIKFKYREQESGVSGSLFSGFRKKVSWL